MGEEAQMPELASSIHDLRVICKACNSDMNVKGEILICSQCGHEVRIEDAYGWAASAGAFPGAELFVDPGD